MPKKTKTKKLNKPKKRKSVAFPIVQKEVTATEISICKGLLLKKLRQRVTPIQVVTRKGRADPHLHPALTFLMETCS